MNIGCEPLAFLAAVLTTVAAFAQEPSTKSDAAQMTPPKPSPDHVKLGFLVGKWSGEQVYAPGPESPEGGKAQGSIESSWDLNDLALATRFKSTSARMSYEARAFTVWNGEKKRYEMHWFDGWGFAQVYTGGFEGEQLVLEAHFDVMGHSGKERVTFSRASATQIRMLLERDTGRGFAKVMESTFARQAGG
ncbi:MAG: DUF1579 family protein [Planctomycetes bacterium]|nr:DUF1579 family protein [Planctomycetota bacterium]